MEITGIDVKPPGCDQYACLSQAVFTDPGEKNIRCGRIFTCFPPNTNNNKWTALVARWLFTSSWNPSNDTFDKNDPILGKCCYLGKWKTDQKFDITTSDFIEKSTLIGRVVRIMSDNHVLIEISEEFVDSNEFKTNGIWLRGPDTGPPIIDTNNVEYYTPDTNKNGTVMKPVKFL